MREQGRKKTKKKYSMCYQNKQISNYRKIGLKCITCPLVRYSVRAEEDEVGKEVVQGRSA